MYLRQAWPLLSRVREALRTEPAVSPGVLFGSRARGDHSEGSDVDLLVGLREEANLRRLASRLSEKIGLRVQLVALEDAQEAPLLLAEVLREGRVVVDRERLWPALLRRKREVERAARRERLRIDAEFSAAFGDGAGRMSDDRARLLETSIKIAQELVQLEGWSTPGTRPTSVEALELLHENGVVTARTRSALKDAQETRSDVQHDYVNLAARDIHAAVQTVLEHAPLLLQDVAGVLRRRD